MYIAPLNLQSRPDIIQAYIRQHGFATLVSTHQNQLFTTHTPLNWVDKDGKQWLYGHIARANEQVEHIIHHAKAKAIFMNSHAYISSSWYDHVNVPTWNYMAVHVHGQLEALDESATIEGLHHLVSQYEDPNQKHFAIAQMTESDFKAHLRGLCGFRLEVQKTEASWKLSQNRDDKNHATIIQKLRERGDELSAAIADEMEKMRPQTPK